MCYFFPALCGNAIDGKITDNPLLPLLLVLSTCQYFDHNYFSDHNDFSELEFSSVCAGVLCTRTGRKTLDNF